MIITRTPFRITLGGGGTDLPSFYERHGGYVFTMAVNKYMYIMLNRRSVADRKIVIRYNRVETVDSIEEIEHPLAREALRLHRLTENIELTSIADMPGKSGLGSSGAYLVGVLSAVRAYQRLPADPLEAAREACAIEMDVLKEPVGKQDPYIAALGGFQELKIDRRGKLTAVRVPLDAMLVHELLRKARVYYTGVQRSATAVLQHQDSAARRPAAPDHERVMTSLLRIKAIGREIKRAFDRQDLDAFARLMDEHWRCKRKMSPAITLSRLDQLYELVQKDYGVLGGKIIGAGGGGFIMLYCPQQAGALDEFMAAQGMPRVNFFPAADGTQVVNDLSPVDDFGR